MITTWGIFWIVLFGASVLKTCIKHLFPLKPMDKERFKQTKELVEAFGKSLTITVNRKGKRKD